MSPSFRRRSLGIVLFFAGFLPARSAPEYPAKGPDIYDVHADGSAQVASAVAAAAGSNKRVIVVFGANWCIWCRRLHGELTKNPAVTKALNEFVVVEVDVNTRNGVNRNAVSLRPTAFRSARGFPPWPSWIRTGVCSP
jgi:thioredoxin-related protein